MSPMIIACISSICIFIILTIGILLMKSSQHHSENDFGQDTFSEKNTTNAVADSMENSPTIPDIISDTEAYSSTPLAQKPSQQPPTIAISSDSTNAPIEEKSYTNNSIDDLSKEAKDILDKVSKNDFEITARVLITAEMTCPYCRSSIMSDTVNCPNCHALIPANRRYIPDRNKLLVSNETKQLLKARKPPKFTIKTALGNELSIKPICTHEHFVRTRFSSTNTGLAVNASNYTVIDFETANMYPDSVCQLGIAIVENNSIVMQKSYYIRPPYNDFRNKNIHGIDLQKVENSPTFAELWPEILPMIENKVVAAYNAKFDVGCLVELLRTFNIDRPSFAFFDILQTVRSVWSYEDLPDYKLITIAKFLGISHNAHDAASDAVVAANVQIATMNENDTFRNDLITTGGDDVIKNQIKANIFTKEELCIYAENILKSIDGTDFNEYASSMETIDYIISHDMANARVCKLCGNAYEAFNMPNNAIEMYEKALSLNEHIGVKGKLKALLAAKSYSENTPDC